MDLFADKTASEPVKRTEVRQHTKLEASNKKRKPIERLKFLKPCPLCGGREFVHGKRGGFFCVHCQPGKEGQPVFALGHRAAKREEVDPPQGLPDRKETARNISRRGYVWVREHLPELLDLGWSRAELFRRSRLKWPLGQWGIAWLPVWEREGVVVDIDKRSGRICFRFCDPCGREIVQTASPVCLCKKQV